MNRILAILAVAAWAASTARPAAAGECAVRVVRAEGVSENMAASVAASIEHNASVAVETVAGGARAEGESAEDFARREGARAEGLTLVLVDWADEPVGGIARADEGFALLNLAQLGDESVPAEALARRADREALRAHAHLMGIPPCPFPLCVLTPCGSVEALDSMSMNYCPPCWDKVRQAEAEQGFDVRPMAREEQESED